MGRKGDPDRDESPDVEIGASVKAKRLRFHEKPRTDVEVHGEVVELDRHEEVETTSGSERRNIPDEVEPGEDYRDVSVRWRATAKIKEDERSPSNPRRQR
jgi:hypothetical protein